MTPRWFHRLLIGGESGPDVDVVHRKLGIPDAVFGEHSRQFVRGLQQAHGLDPNGVVDDRVAVLLGEAADAHLTPEWFSRSLRLGCHGEDVAELRHRLMSGDTAHVFDQPLHNAVLRFQSSRGLPLTGVVDEALALLLP